MNPGRLDGAWQRFLDDLATHYHEAESVGHAPAFPLGTYENPVLIDPPDDTMRMHAQAYRLRQRA